jgi:sugar-specific transcriptional regulator TrmB
MEELKTLQTLGLTEKEARVYLAILELGTASAQSVANKSDVKKPTTYLALEELRKKGLVTKIPQPRKVIYRANSPYELENVINNQVKKAQRLLPELAARFRDTSRVRMTFYEGPVGMRAAYMHSIESLKGSTDYAFYGIAEKISKETKSIIDEWRQINKELSIKTVAIAPKHPSLQNYRDEDSGLLVETTTVPLHEYGSRISVESIGDIVRIMLLENEQAIVIEDKAVADAFKQIFKLAQKGACS